MNPSSSSRPASSASQRPPSNASLRPPSSASHRPPSSASLRTQSSASQRPVSSASNRTASRLSHRPTSRHSRPATRHSSRILPLCQALVTQVTGITAENDEENFRTACDSVSKNVEYASKAGVGLDMAAVDKQIMGHAQKSRINSRDDVADALEVSYKLLKARIAQHESERDVDDEIKISHLPDHFQLLTLLSLPSDSLTVGYAEAYLARLNNPPPPPPSLTWADILAEEPFEGQHWEGAYGLPPGSTRENWDTHSGGSTPSLSPLDDSDELDDSLSSLASDDPQKEFITPLAQNIPQISGQSTRDYSHRRQFEELQARQYWRDEWRTDAPLTRPFDIGDASTLGPSLRRVLGEHRTLSIDAPEQERYIHEHDAVREILMALQGRRNLLISDDGSSFTPSRTAPRLVHLTLTSQASLFTSFASSATTVARLRRFVSSIFTQASLRPVPSSSSSRRSTRTLEAFADAADREIQSLERWCAAREEAMCLARAGVGSPLVVSVLSLEKAIRDTFSSTFAVLLSVLCGIVSKTSRSESDVFSPASLWLPSKVPPAGVSALLLDTLLHAMQEHMSMGDRTTSDALMRVFARTAEPVWAMVGRWLQTGMPVGMGSGGALDEEFFIEDNELVLVDPDFWTEGYALREGSDNDGDIVPKTIPDFLRHVAGPVLGSGKAVGLLRALGVPPLPEWGTDSPWYPFKDILAADGSTDSSGSPMSISTDTLSQLVFDELQPRCEAICLSLTEVLLDECALWRHLSAIEDLYMMRRGDAMSNFADTLFAKMDSHQSWGDFHFLNSAFGDVIEAGATNWIETSLVRLSYRGSKDKDRMISRTVKAMDGLLVEYAVPFPLTYIFGPRVLQIYGSVFVLLLQIRRAKSVLERILVRGVVGAISGLTSEMKAFYAMRSKLSWFINTLLNFLTTHVIHAQVLDFHDAFRNAKSLDEMIGLHDEHLDKIEGRCLLQSNTSALHRAILSILDIGLHFSDYFVSFAGEATTHDISRQSISMRRHRSRRQRRQRKNIIGFSQSLRDSIESSEDDDSDQEGDQPEPSFSIAISSVSSADDGFFNRLDKMSKELDGLVRFIRRGVESLAGGTGDAAPAFGVFAFALEDWDT